MADPKQHWMDTLADEILEQMYADEDVVVEQFLGGQRPPGTVNLTEKEKLALYKRYLLNPDGTWNIQHQQNLLNTLDEKDYIKIIQALNSNNERGLVGTDRSGRALGRRKHSLIQSEGALYGEE